MAERKYFAEGAALRTSPLTNHNTAISEAPAAFRRLVHRLKARLDANTTADNMEAWRLAVLACVEHHDGVAHEEVAAINLRTTRSPNIVKIARHTLALSDLIGRRVPLQRRGDLHFGPCPFCHHRQRMDEAEIQVDDRGGWFYCPTCRASGDAIGFLMRTESLDFPGAVEKLAAERSAS